MGVVLGKPELHQEGIALLPAHQHLQEIDLHYQRLLPTYRETYGSILQAVRPANVEELLAQEMKTMGLVDGMHILDAGCGLCGPSIWFAQRCRLQVTAVTLSKILVEQARRSVDEAGLSGEITVLESDFHHLSGSFPAQSYDRVMFLETIGYSHDLPRVLRGAHQVLKPGGCLYVKDWFRNQWPPGSREQGLCDQILRTVYEEYRWVTFSREELHLAVQEAGFQILHSAPVPFQPDPTVMLSFDAAAGHTWTQFIADGFAFGQPSELLARRL